MSIAVEGALNELAERQFVARIWRGDGSLWGDDPNIQSVARDRLGWLHTPEIALGQVNGLQDLVAELRRDGFTHAVQLGMGGSSLAPEVLRETFGIAPGYLQLHVLDSTDPVAVRTVEQALDLERTLFIVASKSGTTTEPAAFMEYFWAKAPRGGQWVAITDPGSLLEQEAGRRGFRRVFPHQPDVGGRYAALTYIGLVPAACMGLDLNRLLGSAMAMARACAPAQPPDRNPGLGLGAVLGAAAKSGRDKLTLFCSPGIGTFGYWVEQLVAESTGKAGTGILPVESEPAGAPLVYGHDRLFVYLRLTGEADPAQDEAAAALAAAGHAVERIELSDRYALGGEFFRWEFAVPVASTLIGVEPFDQPNVQESKDNTTRLLKLYAAEGSLPVAPALLVEDGIRLSAQGRAADAIHDTSSLAGALHRFLALVNEGDYLAFLTYMPAPAQTQSTLTELRVRLRDRLGIATTSGYGPRFLHSTGQLHKGGADNGLFVQIVSHAAADLEVPGLGYSFETLKQAQALGDLQSLQARGRRALRIDIIGDAEEGLRRIAAAFG